MKKVLIKMEVLILIMIKDLLMIFILEAYQSIKLHHISTSIFVASVPLYLIYNLYKNEKNNENEWKNIYFINVFISNSIIFLLYSWDSTQMDSFFHLCEHFFSTLIIDSKKIKNATR